MPIAGLLKNEHDATQFLERVVWQSGPICPHCKTLKRSGRLNGKTSATGTWKCYQCRKTFSVRHETLFYNSHMPLQVSLQAIYLLVATDWEIGAGRLATVLGVATRSAWLFKRRVRDGLLPWSPDRVRPFDPQDLDTLIQAAEWQRDAERPQELRSATLRYERFREALSARADAACEQRFVATIAALLPAGQGGRGFDDESAELPGMQLELFKGERIEDRRIDRTHERRGHALYM